MLAWHRNLWPFVVVNESPATFVHPDVVIVPAEPLLTIVRRYAPTFPPGDSV
jgi:hypothetical protein